MSLSVCTSTDAEVCIIESTFLGDGVNDTWVCVADLTPGFEYPVWVCGVFLPLPLPLTNKTNLIKQIINKTNIYFYGTMKQYQI